VNGSTNYVDPAVSGMATFVNICVGDVVGVAGTVSSPHRHRQPRHQRDRVSPAKTTHQPPGVFGTVASVNGSSMSGTCGTAGDTFTLVDGLNATHPSESHSVWARLG